MAMHTFSIEKHIAKGFENALQKLIEIMLCLTFKAQFCFEKHWTIHVVQFSSHSDLTVWLLLCWLVHLGQCCGISSWHR